MGEGNISHAQRAELKKHPPHRNDLVPWFCLRHEALAPRGVPGYGRLRRLHGASVSMHDVAG